MTISTGGCETSPQPVPLAAPSIPSQIASPTTAPATGAPAPASTTSPPIPVITPTPAGIVINHLSTDINKIPLQWISEAKSRLKVLYFRASHGGQITIGMRNLKATNASVYDFNRWGTGGALSYQEVWADLGHNGDLTWVGMTRKQLHRSNNDRNVIIWSWCGGVSDNTQEGIDIYLEAMNKLERDYPGVTFAYMTGHVDGTGESGNLNILNNQIRSFAQANGKLLYDFADIESYDPDGNYFLDRNVKQDCSYDSGNWAEEWCARHPNSMLAGSGYFQHTHVLNCNSKAIAFWWLMARIAGWPGP